MKKKKIKPYKVDEIKGDSITSLDWFLMALIAILFYILLKRIFS